MAAGEKKDLSKVSVGNIMIPSVPVAKKHPDWPKWTRTLLPKTVKIIEEKLKEGDDTWSDLEDDYGPIGGSWTTSRRNAAGKPKRKSNAREVKRRLRATKRRGKRRTKRQLLQDVLD